MLRVNLDPVRAGQIISPVFAATSPANVSPAIRSRPRSGFTLIEMLIVMVILGILTAIAMPQLAKTRERGYFKAMTSDMRNLMTQQEIYFSNPAYATYANDVTALANFQRSPGVNIVITEAGNTGWAATAAHAALTGASRSCAVYMGNVTAVPNPATQPGTVMCTGE